MRARIVRAVALLFTVLLGVVVVRAWAPDLPAAEVEKRWATPPSFFVTAAGVRLHVRDEGPRDDPTPLLLLHGTAASLHTWDGWAKELSPRRRVVRIDLPGFALTGPFPSGLSTLEHTNEVLLAFLDAMKLDRVVLVGNSYGGHVAWRFTMDHGERVHRLVLVDAAGYPREDGKLPLGLRVIQWPAGRALSKVLLPRSQVERSVRQSYADPSKVTDALVDRYFELMRREGNRDALALRFLHVSVVPPGPYLQKLKTKTLLLWGKHDTVIPLDEGGLRFKKDLPDAELVVFDHLGHVPQEEDPVATAAALERFLSQP